MSKSNDSPQRTLIVAVVLCLVCSILVSLCTVALRPIQKKNAEKDMKKNILIATGMYEKGIDIEETFSSFQPLVINFETGLPEDSEEVEVSTFDMRDAVKNPEKSTQIPAPKDYASLKRRSKYGKVYLLPDSAGDIEKIVLPFRTIGLWSNMYAYLVLAGDFNTVLGLQFYEHGETPGLGGEVTNPSWYKQWKGKKVYGPEGEVQAALIKGGVKESDPLKEYHVDGLAGATITADAVTNGFRYWLGQHAFKSFLDNLKSGQVQLSGL